MTDKSDRAKAVLAYLRNRGWMGEAGIGIISAVVAGVLLHLYTGPATVWGVPLHILYGGGLGAGIFLLAAALRLIPTQDSERSA